MKHAPKPRDSRVWHHLVLTTYGAWLPGDPRGFRTRHHRKHVEGDYHSPPPEGAHAETLKRSERLLKQAPVVLSRKWREVIGYGLWQEFTRLKAWVLAIAVSGQHAHVLVKLPPAHERLWRGRAKRAATLKVRGRGWEGELWGVRGKAVRIRDSTHQENAFRYIVAHAKQGAWVRVWMEEGGEQSVPSMHDGQQRGTASRE